MANNDNVRIKIVGTIGSAALAKPRTTPKNDVPQYQINIQNPNFNNNNLQDARVQNAIAKLKLRIRQPNSEYPNPSIFVGLPEHNQNSTKENHVLFYDYKTRTQQTIDKDPAIGQTVEVYVDTYNTANELARKYGSRSARLLYVVFPDISKVEWFEPFDEGLAGFTPLDEQANNGAQATAQQVPQAPQFNSSTPAADPFGPTTQQGGQTTQATQNAPQNAFTQSQQVQPAKTNPLLGGQANTNAGPFTGNGQAQTDPFTAAGQTNAQAAPTTPTNTGVQGGQAQADPFTAAGQANTQAPQSAPTNTGVQGGQAQADPFTAGQANTQAAPTTPTNTGVQGGQAQADPFTAGQANTQAPQSAPTNTGVQGGQAQTDPFAGTGDTVDISDEDLPF